jgi:hypothetical protein
MDTVIENFFAKIKQFRALATRCEKTARNFLAALQLVDSVVWLGRNKSTQTFRRGRVGRQDRWRTQLRTDPRPRQAALPASSTLLPSAPPPAPIVFETRDTLIF